MTIKGKRATALREMDHAEASGYMMGGCVDESFDVEAVHAALRGTNVDLAAFDTFFGPLIGRFRDFTKARTEQPKTAGELALIQEAMDSIEQTRRRLEYLPPDTDALINEVCWKRHHELFIERQQRIDADLKEAWTLLALTERKLEPFKNIKPKSAGLRDHLLHDVAHWMGEQAGIKPTAAAAAAADVLRAVAIEAPDDPKKARGIVRAVEIEGGLKIAAN